MRVPQVSERIKEAPAQALRGVFAGIGQLLLITDKLRHKTPAHQDVPRARTPEAAETVTDTTVTSPEEKREEAAPAEAAAPVETAVAEPAPAPAKPAAAKPAATKPAATKPTASRRSAAKQAAAEAPAPAKRQGARDFDKTGNVRLLGDKDGGSAPAAAESEPAVASGPADAAPPLPNYDELSVASLRARLRNLDIAQVRGLADYERAHAARADVLAMYERRIAKLEAEA